MSTYFDSLNQTITQPLLTRLREQAMVDNIPIVQEDGLRFIKQLLQLTKPTRILEIGTAIGYSTIAMALFCEADITTIERDPLRAEKAKKNFKEAKVTSRITLLEEDALSIDANTLEKIDILFIDAAKAQSINFVEQFESLLREGGLIITDNLLFHGLFDEEVESRNVKQLLRKINDFNTYILQKDGYDTVIYNIGDGMSVSIKKGGTK